MCIRSGGINKEIYTIEYRQEGTGFLINDSINLADLNHLFVINQLKFNTLENPILPMRVILNYNCLNKKNTNFFWIENLQEHIII